MTHVAVTLPAVPVSNLTHAQREHTRVVASGRLLFLGNWSCEVMLLA